MKPAVRNEHRFDDFDGWIDKRSCTHTTQLIRTMCILGNQCESPINISLGREGKRTEEKEYGRGTPRHYQHQVGWLVGGRDDARWVNERVH